MNETGDGFTMSFKFIIGSGRRWNSADPFHRRGICIFALGRIRRAGNSVRDVIVATVGMRDGVPANRTGATLKPNDLALKPITARQDDAATVQKWQQIAEQFTLGLLGQVV